MSILDYSINFYKTLGLLIVKRLTLNKKTTRVWWDCDGGFI